MGDPIAVGSQPGDIATGAGAVWVANTADGTVTRIDASSGQPDDPIQVAQYQVLGLSFGEDGVWVAKTDDRLARTIEVVRIDPGSSQRGRRGGRGAGGNPGSAGRRRGRRLGDFGRAACARPISRPGPAAWPSLIRLPWTWPPSGFGSATVRVA